MSEENKKSSKASRRAATIFILLALPIAITYMNNQFSNSRKIASTESEGQLDTALASADLSGSNPNEFQKAFKYQLLKSAQVTDFSDGMRLHMGHFYMRGDNGQKISVCDRYPFIELAFTAEGVAVSGDTPHTLVQGKCVLASDGLHLEGIVVELPRDHGYQWVWTGIKLFNQDKSDYLEVTGYEIISVLGTPLSFNE
ncbi:hypothetical protein [Bdellovibrio sp. HCB209]|uniref:hypothetical protein n=1 Tax=Bdellovibrio sp. HCB209 TaxID=3394354 RepID=UPI0039B609BD